MAYDFQVVIDAAQPHEQADWWARTLGWAVEEQDEAFIRKMIAEGFAQESDTTTHHGSLVWKEGAAIRSPDNTRRVLFQAVPEAKVVKNRVHLDIRVPDRAQAVVDELIARGATKLHDGQQGPHTWVTLADPEGNEFCVAEGRVA
ncbi:MAG TPA: VOC family protein [Micromonosporaceae bacterium]|jgi:hypothetical protein